jgi:hypothetical protein
VKQSARDLEPARMPPEKVFTSDVRGRPARTARAARGALVALAARHAVQHAVDVHVLPGREVLVEARVLEDDADALAHLVAAATGSRPSSSSEPLVGCSSVVSIRMVVVFPPRWAEEGEDLAASHVERDVVDRGDVAELLDEVLDRMIGACRPSRGARGSRPRWRARRRRESRAGGTLRHSPPSTQAVSSK